MTEQITGIIAGVNQKDTSYGVIINDVWYNGKGKCPVNKDDNVALKYEINKQYKNIVSIYTTDEAPKTEYKETVKSNSAQVKVFEHLPLDQLETALNEFNKEHNVIATQVFLLVDTQYDAIVYYK